MEAPFILDEGLPNGKKMCTSDGVYVCIIFLKAEPRRVLMENEKFRRYKRDILHLEECVFTYCKPRVKIEKIWWSFRVNKKIQILNEVYNREWDHEIRGGGYCRIKSCHL